MSVYYSTSRYAQPVQPSSTPAVPTVSRTISSPSAAQGNDLLTKEVKLWNDSKERERIEQMADLYSIIKTTEHLERAFVRDAVAAQEYTPACAKLIAQFKTQREALKDCVPSIESFIAEYKMNCPAAANRLKTGVPATVEHAAQTEADVAAKHVAEATQHFITAMDSLKLNMSAVDQLFPLLNDLLESMNKIPRLGPDFDGKLKVKAWLQQLHAMKASDTLDADQCRQLSFELETSYNAFHRCLKS
mmetsp:Transcript_12825/g.22114  ORF Transcript_12825/g.22114 Transcript_12825/m.22114 type:complete len:246 (+) Transcript_12825:77-814(+)